MNSVWPEGPSNRVWIGSVNYCKQAVPVSELLLSICHINSYAVVLKVLVNTG